MQSSGKKDLVCSPLYFCCLKWSLTYDIFRMSEWNAGVNEWVLPLVMVGGRGQSVAGEMEGQMVTGAARMQGMSGTSTWATGQREKGSQNEHRDSSSEGHDNSNSVAGMGTSPQTWTYKESKFIFLSLNLIAVLSLDVDMKETLSRSRVTALLHLCPVMGPHIDTICRWLRLCCCLSA